MFRFESGGRHHFQGFGEWIVEFTAGGSLKIQQWVGENLKVDKELSVKPPDKQILIGLIEGFPLEILQSSTRPGVPDEVQLVFVVQNKPGQNGRQFHIWYNDAQQQPFLKEFVKKIKEFIQKYTGKSPVI